MKAKHLEGQCPVIGCASATLLGLTYCREHYLSGNAARLYAEIEEAQHAVGEAEHILIEAEDWLAALNKHRG